MYRVFVVLAGLASLAMGAVAQEPQNPPPGSAAEIGTWVARMVEDRDTGRDVQLEMRMRLFDKRDRMRERSLTVVSLRDAPEGTDGDRSLIRFSYPNDIAGTGFLVWEHPADADERFLFLPSLGRVRRIVASEAQDSFVGSDFTYEDIGGREFDDYTYQLISTEPWTDADGAEHQVYRLQSRSKDSAAKYPRIISLVRRDNFVVVHADIYNRRAAIEKRYDVLRLEQIEGYWTAMAMRMVDAEQDTKTELLVESADYNVGLTPAQFSRQELQRGRIP